MTLLVASDPRFWEHEAGTGHPERPARLDAVERGIEAAGLSEAVTRVAPRPATDEELARVHDPALVAALDRFGEAGGGAIDADTAIGPRSMGAARLAVGAGLVLAERLSAGDGEAGFCAVRPPGHHATPRRAMGFCLFNNVAVVAATLAAAGERVTIVDYDAHHGNGTQDAFWDDGRVLYASLHEWPLYPGTGALHETGAGPGAGSTINVPLPAGATGDVYRQAVADLIAPAAEAHGTTWLLVSAGFDAHRADPLTGLGLTAADFADVTGDLLALAPPGRRLLFLEGGYDLDGLAASVGATLGRVLGLDHRPERPTSGGPGAEVVGAAQAVHARAGA
ncbi:MAG TPA: histone deacetylase [Acidimicrobiales bacterium]|nr:histone deacetylase [Acidimicrobiales bacterium]